MKKATAGAVFILIGVICNQRFLACAFSPDKNIGSVSIKVAIWIFDLFFVSAGIFLLAYDLPPVMVLRKGVFHLRKIPKKFKIFFFCAYTLFFLEGMSRLVIAVEPIFWKIIGRGHYCDTIWRHLWLKRHQGLLITYNAFDKYDPARGWALKESLREISVFDGKTLNSNSRGIRGKTEYGYDKKGAKPRILILGDSFTFGDEVSDDETYAYYLQELFPSAEVMNFGVSGYGHDQMLIYLREEGLKYKPDVIILGFLYENIYRNLLEFRDYAKPRFVLIDNELRLKNSPVLPPAETIRREVWHSKFMDLVAILYSRWLGKTDLYEKRERVTAEAILNEIAEESAGIGATVLFIYMPTSYEIGSIAPSDEEIYFTRYCKKRGIHHISARPYFALETMHGARLKIKGHWDAREHRIVAEIIKNYMLANHIISSRQ